VAGGTAQRVRVCMAAYGKGEQRCHIHNVHEIQWSPVMEWQEPLASRTGDGRRCEWPTAHAWFTSAAPATENVVLSSK